MFFPKACVLTAFLGLVAASSALAAEEGFYPPQKFPQGGRPIPVGLDQAIRASYRLEDDTSTCSGSFVSRDGYFLTANHCVSACLEDAHALVQEAHGERWVSFEVKPKAAKGRVCGKHFIQVGGQRLEKPQLVATGPGYAMFDDFKALDMSREEVLKYQAINRDFAILKFKLPRGMQVDCVPVATRPVATGDRVWLVGFPGPAERPGGWSSDGNSQRVSYGKVVKDVRGNEFYAERKVPPGLLDTLARIYGQPELFASSLDTFPGNSGSTVLNAQGQAVGVYTSLATPDEEPFAKKYYANASIALRMGDILAGARDTLGTAKLTEVFNCPAK